ncbi:hypothetical protein QBC33DRAFT_529226 [Phialemonium atrogriseum]|uniref:Uncharacterized protein n=1 Tax=Phialemonium atrogriseum TaxID=1093897 RepID=A0AAJ0C467_9PEZI|nr:uncharacterized protein QBC33DRAFT_529226 [Phialemonium atrogriseum]KAK1769820.1 hypothetical protein QBC33DRAFT_529226 [Phialemonium atrogriseum]
MRIPPRYHRIFVPGTRSNVPLVNAPIRHLRHHLAMPENTTTSTGSLPSPADRDRIAKCLAELVQAIQAHPQMQPPNPHRTLFHLWDFVQRTRYIVSELDNIEAGRPLRHPEQIPEYRNGAAPGPQTALKCMSDVTTRSQTLHMMIMDPSIMLPIMGLACVDYGDEIKEKSKALVDCLEAVKGS